MVVRELERVRVRRGAPYFHSAKIFVRTGLDTGYQFRPSLKGIGYFPERKLRAESLGRWNNHRSVSFHAAARKRKRRSSREAEHRMNYWCEPDPIPALSCTPSGRS